MALPDINLHELSIDELGELRQRIDNYLSVWFGITAKAKAQRTPEWIEAARWRLEGQTEYCCECGESYPSVDFHLHDEIYCAKCRSGATP